MIAWNNEANHRVQITRPWAGLCHMQVCVAADATDEEILEICNAVNPSGTSRGWETVDRGDVVPCANEPGRIHLIVEC